VVSTPLKNTSQLEFLFPIYGKMFQTTNQDISTINPRIQTNLPIGWGALQQVL
jgi:hypothetical protein